MECPDRHRTLAWIDSGAEDPERETHAASCSECAALARGRRLALRATALDSEAPPVAVGTPPGDDAAAAACFAPGTFVGGRYRIVRFIARGGMGEVYEAFDEELRVRVALKAAARTTGTALERFRREVLLARRVTHRNVCRVFELGFEPAGGHVVPYCTMELLEGTTLAARLDGGPARRQAVGDRRSRRRARRLHGRARAAREARRAGERGAERREAGAARSRRGSAFGRRAARARRARRTARRG